MVSALLKYPYCSSQFALQKLEKGIDTNRLSLGCKSVGVSCGIRLVCMKRSAALYS